MRILIAPDKFAGTLTASQAARAIASGWSSVRPDDDLDLAPMSDGGPGFLAARAIGLPEQPGSGAAGGLGHALLALGATRRPGFDVVADAVGLPDRAARADLLITGEGSYDDTGGAGKVPDGVRGLGRPTLVLAGRVQHPAASSYSLVDLVGAERATAHPAAALAELAREVAANLREAPE